MLKRCGWLEGYCLRRGECPLELPLCGVWVDFDKVSFLARKCPYRRSWFSEEELVWRMGGEVGEGGGKEDR